MTVLVTGGTGFIGAAVVRKLLARGSAVRVLARPDGDRSNLSGLDVEIVEGDLRSPESLGPACRGIAGLYHVAADYRLWVRDPQELMTANVDGSRNILREAASAGATEVVYTSSVAVMGIHSDGTPSNEDTPVSLEDMVGNYKRSKYLAEKEVDRLVAEEGIPAIIVNPTTPVGPRDIKPTPTGRVIFEAARGKIPAFVDTGLNIAHVDDVAEGHLLAAAKGVRGERYIIGGEDMTLRQILSEIAALVGRRPPRIRLPRGLVFPVAYIAEAWARITDGPEPMTTVDGLRMSRKKMFFSSDKARRDLGYSPRPAKEALEDAIAWLRETGRLPQK